MSRTDTAVRVIPPPRPTESARSRSGSRCDHRRRGPNLCRPTLEPFDRSARGACPRSAASLASSENGRSDDGKEDCDRQGARSPQQADLITLSPLWPVNTEILEDNGNRDAKPAEGKPSERQSSHNQRPPGTKSIAFNPQVSQPSGYERRSVPIRRDALNIAPVGLPFAPEGPASRPGRSWRHPEVGAGDPQ
jgi:hypothetical protein